MPKRSRKRIRSRDKKDKKDKKDKRDEMKKLIKRVPKKTLEKLVEGRVFGDDIEQQIYVMKQFPEKYFTLSELKKNMKTKKRNNLLKRKVFRNQSFEKNINGNITSWNVNQDNKTVTVKKGNKGRTNIKTFDTIDKASAFYNKKVQGLQ